MLTESGTILEFVAAVQFDASCNEPPAARIKFANAWQSNDLGAVKLHDFTFPVVKNRIRCLIHMAPQGLEKYHTELDDRHSLGPGTPIRD